jgi:hypothetical protein
MRNIIAFVGLVVCALALVATGRQKGDRTCNWPGNPTDPNEAGLYCDYVPEVFWGDCNRNGVCDDEDINVGTSADCNSNFVPDECECDDDHDGIINDCDPGCCLLVGDLNNDCVVDMADFAIFAAHFGESCP